MGISKYLEYLAEQSLFKLVKHNTDHLLARTGGWCSIYNWVIDLNFF